MQVIKLPITTKLQSKMLDYILRVFDSQGNVVEALRFKGYSGHSMWDEEYFIKTQYPKEKGFTIDW